MENKNTYSLLAALPILFVLLIPNFLLVFVLPLVAVAWKHQCVPRVSLLVDNKSCSPLAILDSIVLPVGNGLNVWGYTVILAPYLMRLTAQKPDGFI